MSLKISFVEGWYSHPLFLDAVREKIEEGLIGIHSGREKAGPSHLHGSQPSKVDR